MAGTTIQAVMYFCAGDAALVIQRGLRWQK